jgi:signal transduction histidine kinase
MIMNNAEKKTLKPIKKLSIVLVLIVLLPALIYTAYEFNSLNENEKLLSDIYKKQLDAILFSVNQYTWDYINNWVEEFEKIRQASSVDSVSNLFEKYNSIIMSSEVDTSFFHYFIFSEKKNKLVVKQGNQVLEKLRNQNDLYSRLKELKKQGYKKIETIIFNESGEDRIIFVFIPDYAVNYEKMVYILARSRDIINIISKKLTSIAADKFKVGIFSKSEQNPIYSNEPFQLDEAKQTKNIWIFPDYFLGISLQGESIESIIRTRFFYSLALILFVDLIMLIGVWLIIRTMKKEMQLTKLKTDFVSNVSHELRTPLALIRMYAETLEMKRVPSEDKKSIYYKIIKQESERLTRLINNILNFSRIESGKKRYNFSRINLNDTINNVIEMYKFHFQNEGFNLNVKYENNDLIINADEEAISEALINLIDNAIKYSEKNKEITISTGKQNNSVFLIVKDQGIGISNDNQKKIFDEFYRVSAGSTFTKKGSGLGLSLVKHIMDAHHGSIEVESEMGKGSIFRLNFKE